MARADPSFSASDILRIIANNLTELERDIVVCSILTATGSLRGRISAGNLLSGGQLLLTGLPGLLKLSLDVILELAGAGRYNQGF